MRFLRYLVLLCIAVIGGTVSAQSQRELGQLMRERGEYYFTLSVDNPKEIQAISEICSVDGTDGRTVVAYANQNEYDRLLQAGYRPELQTPPSMRANVTMWNGQGTYNWDSYLTYDQYVSMMEGFPSKAISGRTCTLFSLGTLSTSNHRQLLGVRINNGSPEGKPKFLYSSTMHGDEITGMILMLRLINELCTSTDSQIVNLVNNLDIYILPLTNPDGTYKGGNSTVNNAQRYNGNNIDLNRNYKDYYQGAHPDGNSYEDETIWTMAMGDENLFTMSANYHGGAEVMNYPWDATYDDHADMAWYEYVCTKYVQVARQTYSSYMSDTYSDGVTNGADWYVITGSRQDYMNAYAQCREVTVECSSTKTPSASSLPSYWNYNHNAMLAFMEQCLYGVHGFVYDANTDQPIEGVKVTVQDHDSQTSFVTTHSVGDFHRPIKGGSYTFEFTKDGYCPYYVDVAVADDQRVELNNIQLTPGNCMVPSFTASTTDVSLGQSISFTDNSFGTIASWSWTFEGATPSTSTAQNPTNITYSTAGDYDVTLTITDAEGHSETLTKENYIHVAESITMQNGTVTTCSGIFYDSGGANSNYGNNLNYTMTFYPGTEGAMVSVNFSQFNTESGYDYLYIYDGTSTDASLIGQYDGTTSPGTVTANNTAGALTFKFTSDSYQNASGWVANISCMAFERTITAIANPADGGTVDGAGIYTPGETCTLTATAAEGYQFIHWTENGTMVSADAIYSFQVTVDRDLVAVFGSTVPVFITVSASPDRAGSVSGGGQFLSGETCTVSATANPSWAFMNWTENGTVVSEDLEYSFMVTNDRDIVANFAKDCGGEVTYERVTEAPSDWSGTYLLVYQSSTSANSGYAFNGTVTGGDGYSTNIAISDGTTIHELGGAAELTIEKVSGSDYYYIKNGSNYLYAQTTSLYEGSSASGNTYQWSLAMSGNYVNIHTAASSYQLYFNTSSSSTYYQRIYPASQNSTNLYLYRKTVSSSAATVSFSPVSGTALSAGNRTVTLTSSVAGLPIYYTTDGTEPTMDSPHAISPVTLRFSDAVTVKAFVYDDPENDGCGIGTTATATFGWASPTSCYDLVTSVSAGQYVMGYLNGTTLVVPVRNNSSTVSSSSVTVTPTDDGFTVDGGITIPQITLTKYNNTTNQFYIQYGGYYLRYSSNLNWSSSTTGSGRVWYISNNGVYTTYNNRTYYLYYNNGSFATSTTAQNNINFYVAGNCPADPSYSITATANPAEGGTIEGADLYFEGETCTLTATANEGYTFINWTEDGVEVSTDAEYTFEVTGERTLVANFEQQITVVEQTVPLAKGLNWWSTNLDITLADLKSAIVAALGSNGTAIIKSQSTSIVYSNGMWIPEDMSFDIRDMYKVQVSEACEITLTGVPVNTSEEVLTINPGNNWIGFPSGTSMTLGEAFAGLNPVNGDVVKSQTGSSVYNDGNWIGTVGSLEPGQGYLYYSKATSVKTFTFPTVER